MTDATEVKARSVAAMSVEQYVRFGRRLALAALCLSAFCVGFGGAYAIVAKSAEGVALGIAIVVIGLLTFTLRRSILRISDDAQFIDRLARSAINRAESGQ